VSLESALASPSSRARKTDGRHLRSERTRLAIIEAYLEVLRRDSVTPTASHIADQAACSVRSEPPRVVRRLFGLSHAAIAGWSSVA
jgi:hypothetical protein